MLSTLLLVAALVLLGALPVGPSPSPSRAAGPSVYIALGDSIAAGIGSSLPRGRSYPALVRGWMEKHDGSAVILENLAVPGETAGTFLNDGQLQRFRDTVARARSAELPIRAVSVTLGGNEMLDLAASGLSDREAGLAAFSQNFDATLAAVRSEVGPDIPIVVTTYYDPTGGDSQARLTDAWWIEQFNSVIRETAGRYGALVADTRPLFQDRMTDYTHYPFDVHPTNDGHAAIARLVWNAMAIDQQPPTIDVDSSITATRSTPTLRFRVDDESGIDSVGVDPRGIGVRGPIQLHDGEYVALLDVSGAVGGEVSIGIEVRDLAGNVTRRDIRITTAYPNGDQS